MKIKKVIVEFGAVVNMGDYNSRRFNLVTEAELEAGETLEGASAVLFERVRAVVREQAKPLQTMVKGSNTDLFRGKEVVS